MDLIVKRFEQFYMGVWNGEWGEVAILCLILLAFIGWISREDEHDQWAELQKKEKENER